MDAVTVFVSNLKEYMDGEYVSLIEVSRAVEELEELITYLNK